jgi:hypothetical protein
LSNRAIFTRSATISNSSKRSSRGCRRGRRWRAPGCLSCSQQPRSSSPVSKRCSDLDAIVARCSGTSLIHLVLPLGRTTQCINHTGKFDQQAIAGRFDDAAPVFGDLRVDNVRPD